MPRSRGRGALVGPTSAGDRRGSPEGPGSVRERGIHCGRVSAHGQVRGASLEQQEADGREWFARRNIEAVRFFQGRAESARTRKRSSLVEAMAFIRAEIRAGRRIHVFLVHDLSRFARNLEDQLAIKRELAEMGVRLDSVMMPLTEDAHGKAQQGYMGVTNQYVSDVQSEKIKACMLVRTKQGRWMHPAPVGYRNRRNDDDSKRWIEPDMRPVREGGEGPATIVRLAFEAFARGARLCDVHAEATKAGLRGRIAGKPLTMRTFRDLLQHPIYAGKVRSSTYGFVVDGQHEPIVDRGTFERVQARLSGRPSAAAPRVREHPDFPLRGFVRCARCGKPLTASWSTGKAGKRYGFYHCWAAGCRAVNVAAGKLEDAFCADLDRRRISPLLMPLVRESCMQVAAEAARNRVAERARAGKRLLDLRAKQDRLVEAFVYEQALSRELYEGQMQGLERELAAAELEHHAPATGEAEIDRMLRLTEPMLTGPAELWRSAPYSARRDLQGLIYPEGMHCAYGQLGTPKVSCLFNDFEEEKPEENRMVARTGFEPVLPA